MSDLIVINVVPAQPINLNVVPATPVRVDVKSGPGPQGSVGPQDVFVQAAQPTPAVGFGEYIWFKTDGSGNVIDILSGVA